MKELELSIVVPCYNEEQNIALFMKAIKQQLQSFSYEIIFINDGSKDHTLHALKKVQKEYEKEQIIILDFSRNFGKESAILAGLKEAKGNFVTIIDADLQQNPKYIKEMLIFLYENSKYDCVAAYQKQRIERKRLIALKNGFYKVMNKVSDVEFVEGASDFRMFRKYVVEAILSLPEYHRFSKGIFSWVGFQTYYMPYEVEERASGSTSWSTFGLFKYALEGILAFSTAPLKISIAIGFLLSSISFLYLVIIVFQKIIFGIDVSGYPTIMVTMLLLGGVQLIGFGVIGEYLSKMYLEVKKRPNYIIKQKLMNQEIEDER